MTKAGANRSLKTLDVADRLHSLAIHLLRRVRKGDEQFGLSAPRLSALSVVVFRGPITVSELANAEGVTAPTMTRLVQALEAGGLVERAPDPTDGRVAVLRATKHGKSLLDAGRKKRITALANLLDDLEPSEFRTLRTAVDLVEGRIRRSQELSPDIEPPGRRSGSARTSRVRRT